MKTKVFPPSAENAEHFLASRKAEINGLIEGKVFAVMEPVDAVAKGDRIYNSRFVDAVKNVGTPRELAKSRFVICGYNNREAKYLLTKVPTVSKNSTRILLSLAARPGSFDMSYFSARPTPRPAGRALFRSVAPPSFICLALFNDFWCSF